MKDIFIVTIDYKENKTHFNTETWVCSGRKKLEKVLGRVFDVYVDERGIPAEPDHKKLEVSLGQSVDKVLVDREFKRLEKAFKIYCEAVDEIFAEPKPGRVRGYIRLERKIDSHTKITVKLRPY